MATQSYKPRLLDPHLDQLLKQLPAVLLIGPRAAGKSTTLERRCTTEVRLETEAEAGAFAADPDAALRGLDEPVLLDEWQNVPSVMGAVRRAVNRSPTPNRFYLTGSVRAEAENKTWPATGRLIRIAMYPMTIREQLGRVDGPSFFDKVAESRPLRVPKDTPDLRGYIELALRSGFPVAALKLTGTAHEVWLKSYIDELLTHELEALEAPTGRPHDRPRLRDYFEAYALSSAGALEHRRLYEAAGVNRGTGTRYDALLADLMLTGDVPAWRSNRLKRLVHLPKRYLIDAALIAAALRMDGQGILKDGDILGRVLDTFVAAQLRPELDISATRPRLYHLRTEQGRQEVDLVAELGGQRVIGIEIKASAAPTQSDARHLIWLRERLKSRFVAGFVLHTGPRAFPLDDRITAAPISTLWG